MLRQGTYPAYRLGMNANTKPGGANMEKTSYFPRMVWLEWGQTPPERIVIYTMGEENFYAEGQSGTIYYWKRS
jgi:hypothetical protein